MIKSLFTVFILLVGLCAQANQDFCVVKSEKYPDLQSGINKSMICNDAIVALEKQTDYKEGYPLELIAVSRETYGVSFIVNYTMHENKYSMRGTENWFPGDSYFTLENNN